MRLLEEIRRRRVGRVVIAYAAAVFVVLQVGDIVLPALDAPDWVMTALVVVAALGFPVAVALAWAFDVTPDGVQRTAPADGSPPRLLGRRGTAVVAAVAAVSLVAGAGYVWLRATPDQQLDADRVVVLPFRVSADASLGYLREGMVDLLATALSDEKGLRAVEPRAALTAWRRSVRDEHVDLDPADAKLVARQLGAGNVVLGSIIATGGDITLTASLIPVGPGRTIEARAQGAAEHVTRLIDELIAQLLSRAAGETDQRLAMLTSTSLPALRAYLEGQAAYRRAQFGVAAQAFDRAVATDSTFALAALQLELMSGWGEDATPNMPRAAELAHRYRDRLPATDRLLLDAHLGPAYPEVQTIAQRLAAWEAALPRLNDRADAWFQYADVMLHYGALADRRDNEELALRGFQRALELDPAFTPALTHLLDGAVAVGDTAEARRLFDLLARTDTSSRAASYQYFGRLLSFGDSATIAGFRAAIDTLPGNLISAIGYGYIFLHAGKVEDSQRALQLQLQRAATAQQRVTALGDLYTLALNRGRPTEAAEFARRALEIASPPASDAWHARVLYDALFWEGDTAAAARSLPVLTQRSAAADASGHVHCALGQWHAWAGNASAAQAAAQRLQQRAQDRVATSWQVDMACAATVLAVVAELQGAPDAARALARADSLAGAGPLGALAALRAANFSIARLHERRGSPDMALGAVRRHVMLPTAVIQYSTYKRETGRLAELTGDREAAIEAYSEYLRMRPDPEPSAAGARSAVEAALARLTGERTR